MRLVVDDEILLAYNSLPTEFKLKDLLKLLSKKDHNYHTVYTHVQRLVEHGALHKGGQSTYHKNFRTIEAWFKAYIRNPEKVRSLR